MRPGYLALAACAAALVWIGTDRNLPGGYFVSEMVRHMTLVAVVAPLAAIGLPPLGWRPGVVFGVLAEFLVVWSWHLPFLHGLACTEPLAKVTEWATFLAAGWLVWAGALSSREPLAGAAGLFLTSMHMSLLGVLLILAPIDLYSAGCALCTGVEGQQFGGILMLLIGTPVYLAGALWLTARALGENRMTKGRSI